MFDIDRSSVTKIVPIFDFGLLNVYFRNLFETIKILLVVI